MPGHLERARNGCALHGALLTLEAIERVIPIIHSTAGCGMQHYLGGVRVGGASLPGIDGGVPLSASAIGEKHVVFGGGSRLREQLKNTVKTVRGDLYAVVTGCATELVGDDVPAMAKEGREQGFPVVHASTAGFRGGPHLGYEMAVNALLNYFSDSSDGQGDSLPGLVNIWGIVPQQDLFWEGNLRELARLIGELGLTPNTLFGVGQTVESWRRAPQASLNLVLSPWGREAARILADRYGTPSIELFGLPVGRNASGRLIDILAERLSLDGERAAAVRSWEESQFLGHLARIADRYFTDGFQREFALVGETTLVLGLTEFLVDTLGLLPRLLVITDNPAEEVRRETESLLRRQIQPYAATVVFSEDSGEIADLVAASGAEVVLGSSLERLVASELDVPLVTVSFPASDRLILTKGYAGYRGAITLLEDLGTAILSHRRTGRGQC